MTPHRGRARARRRRRAALGHRLRHDRPVVRQHHRHPQGRHPRRRLRAGPDQDAQRAAARASAAAGRRGRRRQGRRPRGPHRGRHRPAGRAAVRGPDQGGPRHLGGHAHRRPRRGQGAQGVPRPPPSAATRPGRAAVLEKVVAAARTRIAARQHKEPSAARTRWRPRRCRPSSPTAAATTSTAASCSSSRATRALGTAKLARNSEFQALLPIRGKILNVQKASVARHAQERRVRRDHPGHRRRARAAPSTSTRPATARSS